MRDASQEAEALVRKLSSSVGIYEYKWEDLKDLDATKQILGSAAEVKRAVVLFTAELINLIWAKWEASEEWGNLWFGNMVEGRTLPRAAMAVSRKLLLQDLNYSEPELVSLVEATARNKELSTSEPFLEPLVKTAEQFVADNGLSPSLRAALKQLRSAIYWDNAPERKLKNRIKLLLEQAEALSATAKVMIGSAPSGVEDRAAFKEAQAQLLELEKFAATGFRYRWENIESHPVTKTVLAGTPELQRLFVVATADRIAQVGARLGKFNEQNLMYFANLWHEDDFPKAGVELCKRLLRRKLEFHPGELYRIVERLAGLGFVSIFAVPIIDGVVRLCEQHAAAIRKVRGFPAQVSALQAALGMRGRADEKKLAERLGRLVLGPQRLPISAGEAWSDAAIADLRALGNEGQSRWLELLAHCQSAKGGAPDKKWMKTAGKLVGKVGARQFKSRMQVWLPLVDEPRSQPINEWSPEYQPDPNQLITEPHADILKGLAWCCSVREDKELARVLMALALSAYRKIPQKGPREVKIGNACVTALGQMPGMEGLYQLALLKVRVKFGTAQKFIETALNATARRVGIPRDELEELAVPAYCLEEVGRCTEPMGGYTAELAVTGTESTAISWIKPDGKRQQSVPAIVKEKSAGELKQLQSAAKDIQRMLPAQRERIDNLFREQKTWNFDTWSERYLNHPLVGVLARRLIWEFTTAGQKTAAVFFNGALVDLDLRPLIGTGAETGVQLWHPIGKDPAEIIAWREWLEEQEIRQPFKQAHREVYLLTDAERQTRTYSNRFAAHILRQHQFNALCAARGWKNRLRLLVDAEFPPATLYLPRWNLRAEFWIEGVGDDYGADTNDNGVFLRVSTDQLRFYRLDAPHTTAHASGGGYGGAGHADGSEPLPLDEIPPLVFSEVMRDVDLFVGVASVGNDPAWVDGGPEGRFRDYWQSYSFGALSGTAKTRLEVLKRLVPRLKIAAQCAFDEKFLVVTGKLRTYKIHLGSGNILMEPNDQYLCIVPRQSEANDTGVLLPFEGDRTLSIIISKALLLSDDAHIKDETITAQIRSR